MSKESENYYEQVDNFLLHLTRHTARQIGSKPLCCNCNRKIVSSGDYCEICQPIIDHKYSHIHFGLNDEK